jgi:hypothetical protein
MQKATRGSISENLDPHPDGTSMPQMRQKPSLEQGPHGMFWGCRDFLPSAKVLQTSPQKTSNLECYFVSGFAKNFDVV